MDQRSVRPIVKLAFLLVFLVAGSCSEGGESPTEPTGPGPDQRVLAVPLVRQETPVWCWAAVSEMVFRYYGRGGTQCQILSGWYQRDCCTFREFCQTTAPIAVIQQTLLVGGVRSNWTPGPLPLSAITAEINAGRPIIVGYRGSFAGHVVVIHGYDSRGNLYIHDPFYGSFVVPYGASFTYGGQFVWSDTIYGIS